MSDSKDEPKIDITKYLGCMNSQELMNVYSSLTGGAASETAVRSHLTRVKEIRVQAKSPKRRDPRASQFCDDLKELIKAKFPNVYNAASQSEMKPGQVLDLTKKQPEPLGRPSLDAMLQSKVPSTLKEGDYIRVERVDAPLQGKKDYSLRLSGGRRVFVEGGVVPKQGDMVKIDRTIRPDQLYAGILQAASAPAPKPAPQPEYKQPPKKQEPEYKPETPATPPAAKPEEPKKDLEPAYLAKLPEATRLLQGYAKTLMESDTTLMEFDATIEGALEELAQGDRKSVV